jgi:hypothetical protein
VPLIGSYLRDPSYYASFLTSIKPDGEFVVGLLAGDPKSTISTMSMWTPAQPFLQPSCMTWINGNPASADAGIRLKSFSDSFGDRGLFRSACQGDYSASLVDFANAIGDAISPCLDGAVASTDVDAKNPGIQLGCKGFFEGASLPECQMLDDTTPDPSGPPCIYITAAPTCAASQLAVHLFGATGEYEAACPTT